MHDIIALVYLLCRCGRTIGVYLRIVDGLNLEHVDVAGLGLDILLSAIRPSAPPIPKRKDDSLDPVNSVHVVRGRNLESRVDVGEVDFTLSVSIRLGSGSGFRSGSRSRSGLGGGGVGSLAPTLFTWGANVRGGVLFERLSLERDGGNTSTARGQRCIRDNKRGRTRG
jgi:hypothetical protein